MSYEDYKLDIKSGHDKLGQLVRDWVNDPKSRPKSIEELKTTLKTNGVTAEIGSKVESINWVSMEYSESITILLPPTELLSQDPPGYDGYPLPDFYSQLAFDNKDKNIIQKDKFRASRVGEYTTQRCW